MLKRSLLSTALTTSNALCCLRVGSHCSDYENGMVGFEVRHVRQALWPFVE